MSILKSLMNGSSLLSVARFNAPDNGLSLSDLAEYTNAYKAKYGEDTALTVEDIVSIIDKSDADATADDIAEAMFEAEGHDEEPATPIVIDTTPGSAFDLASKMDEQFEADLETSAKAALENKRGAAVIMLDLFRLYGKETVYNSFPVPGSKKWEQTDNVPADKYKSVVRKEDGTTAEGERSWYMDFIESSSRGKKLIKERDSLKGIKAGETGPHILPEHEELRNDLRKIVAARSAIDGKISNMKAAIIRSVNLAQRMNFLNTKTGMGVELITDEDGAPAQSNKLVYVYDTTDQKKFNILTIGQLLALKMIEGGTYAAISGTTQRQPKKTGTTPVEVTVNSLDDFDKVTSAYATFFDKIKEQMDQKNLKAYNALLTRLNAAGSDDLLLSLNLIMNTIEGLLSKPGIDRRLSDLLAEGGKKAAA